MQFLCVKAKEPILHGADLYADTMHQQHQQ